jgi:hypothetical protein
MSIEVFYDEDQPPLNCSSPTELHSMLARLAADSARPILVDIHVPGFIVQTGIGLDPTFVVINAGQENDGEYVITVGDEHADGPDCTCHE